MATVTMLSSPANISPVVSEATISAALSPHDATSSRVASEVLLVCLIHDSPQLRLALDDVFSYTLEPLLRSMSKLYRTSNFLVGGVVYRSMDADALAQPLRSLDAVTCVPFLTIRHFLSRVQETLRDTSVYDMAQLDDSPRQSSLVDALAAAMDLVDAREKPSITVPFARSAVRGKDPVILARHIMQIIALDSNAAATPIGQSVPQQLPVSPANLRPLMHRQASLDACTFPELVQELNKRRFNIGTVIYSSHKDETGLQTRAALAQTAHDTLCLPRASDEQVSPSDLLDSPKKLPSSVSVLLTGSDVARLLRKRPRLDLAADSPNKRARQPPTPTTPTFKLDQASLNRIMLIQQQQATMLKNLARYVATNVKPNGTVHVPPHYYEKIRQRIVGQQMALKQQAERLRVGKVPDLNSILQALSNIDAEAKEAGVKLGGPSNVRPTSTSDKMPNMGAASLPPATAAAAAGNVTPSPTAQMAVPAAMASRPQMPSSDESSRPQLAWQGIIKWSTSPQMDPLFTLVTATCGGMYVKQQLALPWPNVMNIDGFVPIDSAQLQQHISAHRLPCALLTLRAFPQNLIIKGSEHNATNYQMLTTMLEQSRRAAFVQHGHAGCGILIVALTGSRLPPTQAGLAPRLLAVVFSSPVPFPQLSASTAPTASITRGMIPLPATANSMPNAASVANATVPSTTSTTAGGAAGISPMAGMGPATMPPSIQPTAALTSPAAMNHSMLNMAQVFQPQTVMPSTMRTPMNGFIPNLGQTTTNNQPMQNHVMASRFPSGMNADIPSSLASGMTPGIPSSMVPGMPSGMPAGLTSNMSSVMPSPMPSSISSGMPSGMPASNMSHTSMMQPMMPNMTQPSVYPSTNQTTDLFSANALSSLGLPPR